LWRIQSRKCRTEHQTSMAGSRDRNFPGPGSRPLAAYGARLKPTDYTFVYGRTPAFCTRFSRKADSLISVDIRILLRFPARPIAVAVPPAEDKSWQLRRNRSESSGRRGSGLQSAEPSCCSGVRSFFPTSLQLERARLTRDAVKTVAIAEPAPPAEDKTRLRAS